MGKVFPLLILIFEEARDTLWKFSSVDWRSCDLHRVCDSMTGVLVYLRFFFSGRREVKDVGDRHFFPLLSRLLNLARTKKFTSFSFC